MTSLSPTITTGRIAAYKYQGHTLISLVVKSLKENSLHAPTLATFGVLCSW